MTLRRLASALLLLGLLGLRFAQAAEPEPLTFEKHIRPILKANCFQCHGETEDLQSGLDLRLRRLIVEGGESGPAIVPGKRDESLLYERISLGEMPPGKKKLPAADVDLIGGWIAEGAKTARPEPKEVAADSDFTEEERSFWSFQPIRRPSVPEFDDRDRVHTPIDAFLVEKLKEHKLAFAPEADKRTLIRRASFDLIGLPPSPEDVIAFVSDDAPDAYERLIDRLLASPHYGERWGRHWLDVAGYADSDGVAAEDTVRKYAYKYRDYVIRSLNSDKPLDEFFTQQLAGDELVAQPFNDLSEEAIENLVATGFLRMGPDGTGSASVDQNVARNQVMAETIKIVSTALLGLSVGCAECHNHRYDPIPQVDYYRLRAIFEPAYDWKNWRAPAARAVPLITTAEKGAASRIEAVAAKIDAQRKQKEQEYIDSTFEKQLARLPEEVHGPLREAFKTPLGKRTPEQKKLLKEHPDLNVSAGSLYLYDRMIEQDARKVEQQRTKKLQEYLARLTKENPDQSITAENLASFDAAAAAELEALAAEAVRIRGTKAADNLKKLTDEAAAIRATKPKEDFVQALTEVPGAAMPVTYLFNRGDFNQPKQAVDPAGLSLLEPLVNSPIPVKDSSLTTSGRRLALAKSLTSGRHPLVARVLVNRVWLHHFGRGIVATPADFGVLGERPSHPELLDWLAEQFMSGGWRLKPLHKLIMMSSAYRQASTRETARDAVDPDNRLLSRMSIRRLEAEVLRDVVLAANGTLNEKMYGEAVPVKEDEVGQIVIGIENKNGENRPGPEIPLHGEEFRRSVYVQMRRTRPLAMLDTFDAPAMEPNCQQRSVSTVTPQSLLLMNSEFVVAAAEQSAERVRREQPGDLRGQVQRAWLLALTEEPSSRELDAATAFVTAQCERLRANRAAGTSGEVDFELQALASFCQAILSSNAFLYVD